MQSSKKEPNVEESEQLKKQINDAELQVVAELGKTDISIEDFLALDAEDVIRLQTSVHDPLTIYVGDRPKFIAQPGKVNRKAAVQILDDVKRRN
jgi:flagellar motor switch protein FliM